MKGYIIAGILLYISNTGHCGTTCLSCSGVETVTACTHLSTCRDNEVCFVHKYVTESNTEKYDFGCTYPELCAHGYASSGHVFGRQLEEGHHMVCQGCCNNTNICNMNTPCQKQSTHNVSAANNPRECDDINSSQTGVYTIYPDGYNPVQVFCIMSNNEKWTVMQRRVNGSVDFYRNWNDYKLGFGSAYGEYWLGNDNIHLISTARGHKLSIYLEDFDGTYKYANYSLFMIGDEYRQYQLMVNGFTGTNGVGDSLSYHSEVEFSTKDRDNDPLGKNTCAVNYHGAWWYRYCKNSNLNGLYEGGHTQDEKGIEWQMWKSHYSFKKTIMMITKKKYGT